MATFPYHPRVGFPLFLHPNGGPSIFGSFFITLKVNCKFEILSGPTPLSQQREYFPLSLCLSSFSFGGYFLVFVFCPLFFPDFVLSLSLSIILRFCQEFLRFELVFKCLNVFGIRKYSRTKSILLRLQISIINILRKILTLESIRFQTSNSDHRRYITNLSRRNKNQDTNK